MAKIPKEHMPKQRANRSPLSENYKKGELHLEGSTLVFPDGSKQQFSTHESAWKAFKLAKKQAGQWY